MQVAGVGDELFTGELVEEVHAVGQHTQVRFGFERVGPCRCRARRQLPSLGLSMPAMEMVVVLPAPLQPTSP